MAELHDLLNTDALNTARFSGSNNVSTLDNAGQALEGMIARNYKDTNGSNTTTGSATAYTLALNRTGVSTNAQVGVVLVRFHVANTGPATITIGTLPTVDIRKAGGAVLALGDILTNDMKLLAFNPAFNVYQIIGQ